MIETRITLISHCMVVR